MSASFDRFLSLSQRTTDAQKEIDRLKSVINSLDTEILNARLEMARLMKNDAKTASFVDAITSARETNETKGTVCESM